MTKYKSEYILKKDYPHLIDKKAKFKQHQSYCKDLWGKTGVIKQLFQVEDGDLDHVGLSLVFDDKKFRMDSCYIQEGSIDLI